VVNGQTAIFATNDRSTRFRPSARRANTMPARAHISHLLPGVTLSLVALKVRADPSFERIGREAAIRKRGTQGVRGETRASPDRDREPMTRPRHEQALVPLARELRRQVVGARAVLLVADALGLSSADLLDHTAAEFRNALRNISVGMLGNVLEAAASADRGRPARAQRAQSLSVESVARFLLDQNVPGSKLDLIEGAMVATAMATCSGNQSAAARLLGIERKALARRLAKDPAAGEGGLRRQRRS
jgi:hypothetical protein